MVAAFLVKGRSRGWDGPQNLQFPDYSTVRFAAHRDNNVMHVSTDGGGLHIS